MADVIAPPSVRALARERGIDLETLAKHLGRTSIAREDLEGGRPPARRATSPTGTWTTASSAR